MTTETGPAPTTEILIDLLGAPSEYRRTAWGWEIEYTHRTADGRAWLRVTVRPGDDELYTVTRLDGRWDSTWQVILTDGTPPALLEATVRAALADVKKEARR